MQNLHSHPGNRESCFLIGCRLFVKHQYASQTDIFKSGLFVHFIYNVAAFTQYLISVSNNDDKTLKC